MPLEVQSMTKRGGGSKTFYFITAVVLIGRWACKNTGKNLETSQSSKNSTGKTKVMYV